MEREIFRKSLTYDEQKNLSEAARSFFEKVEKEETEAERERKRRINEKLKSGEYVKIDGKIFEAKYYKGAKK